MELANITTYAVKTDSIIDALDAMDRFEQKMAKFTEKHSNYKYSQELKKVETGEYSITINVTEHE